MDVSCIHNWEIIVNVENNEPVSLACSECDKELPCNLQESAI